MAKHLKDDGSRGARDGRITKEKTTSPTGLDFLLKVIKDFGTPFNAPFVLIKEATEGINKATRKKGK